LHAPPASRPADGLDGPELVTVLVEADPDELLLVRVLPVEAVGRLMDEPVALLADRACPREKASRSACGEGCVMAHMLPAWDPWRVTSPFGLASKY
jgi:hypothetical protein